MIVHFEHCIDSRGADYLEKIFKDISIAMNCTNSIAAIKVFEEMVDEMDLNNPNACNREKELEILTGSVNPM